MVQNIIKRRWKNLIYFLKLLCFYYSLSLLGKFHYIRAIEYSLCCNVKLIVY